MRTNLKHQVLFECAHFLRLELHDQHLRGIGWHYPPALLHLVTIQNGGLISFSRLRNKTDFPNSSPQPGELTWLLQNFIILTETSDVTKS